MVARLQTIILGAISLMKIIFDHSVIEVLSLAINSTECLMTWASQYLDYMATFYTRLMRFL